MAPQRAGTIERTHLALKIALDTPYPLGDLVIGAGDARRLFSGKQVDVAFVQQRPGRDPYLGFAGTARFSRAKDVVTARIDGRTFTASGTEVSQVYEGSRHAAPVNQLTTAPAPIIDADLVRAF